MSDTSSQPADQAQPADFLTAFWAVKHALAHTSATAFAEHGIYEGQQWVLRTLWSDDGLTPGEVARRLNLATPTVTRASTRMEAAGPGPAVMIGRPPPPAAPKSGPPWDRPCHPKVAGQDTACKLWSGYSRRYAPTKLGTSVEVSVTEEP